jgi:hypothetical protein
VARRFLPHVAVLITPPESLVPFDLESTWSASVVILVAHAVDPSLLRNVDELRQIAFAVLSEMVARGNRVAGFYKSWRRVLSVWATIMERQELGLAATATASRLEPLIRLGLLLVVPRSRNGTLTME